VTRFRQQRKSTPNKDASKSEIEYTGYLSPEALKSLPVATTVGNHDADNANYTYHFNRTNASELGSNKVVGGDYYFKYGNALFIMLNTQDTNVAEHKQFIEQTVAANKDCKWRIVTLHQDIYGSAEHSNEPEITNLRYQLTPIFEQNDIDAVLTGHDHAYSRSKMLLGGTKANDYTDNEFDAELEKDMDAGENPTTKTVAPGNIKNRQHR
jgi:Calcineurin-like phosphoesterase.